MTQMDEMSPWLCPRRSESFIARQAPEGGDVWRHDGTCSYCGSMQPQAVFAAIDRGDFLGPTDKSYKVYVGERRKFYFQHFDDADKGKFIDALNAGAVKIGYPGHFYVLPFFIQMKPADL